LQSCKNEMKKSDMTNIAAPVKIEKSIFGVLPDQQQADLFTMTNKKGMQVKITNYGGIITSWTAPDKNGLYEDIVLGYDSLDQYAKNNPYFGAIIGRYGNRIAKGKFSLDGKNYSLAVNNIGNHLHGGIVGFDKVLWTAEIIEDKWDVVNMSLSENEKYRTVFINEDGKNKILLFDHATGKQVKFPEIVDGDVLGVNISRSEQNMLLSIGSSTSPRNLYLYNITNNELKKLTNSLNPAINEDDLVKAEVVRFKSFDGMEIPAIYYKPLQADKNNKAGALVWVHGGPGGQSRVGFSNSIQYLVNHGYAVLAVNNRGSSGYGKSFYKMDNKDHSNGDLKDCIYGKKWLQQQEYIDSSAIGIYGGSYGGCMVLGALAFHPDEFKVGVNLFGVANWLRTLKSIPPYWESFRKALYDEMGDPYTQDSVRLRSISPLFNYEKINKPLLVFQGSNDVRVLKVESDEIVAGVKKNGVPVEYVLYPDEGHGFNKKENQMTTSIKTLEFLDKYLKPKKELKD